MSRVPTPTIEFLGDRVVLLSFGELIDATLSAHVHTVTQSLRDARLPGLIDIVPAYASIAVHYDPLLWHDAHDEKTAGECLALALSSTLTKFAPEHTAAALPCIDIPVCYEGDFAVDLDEVARHAGLAPSEIVERHTAAEYQVAMLGFAPGFAYLLGLDARLHVPRRASPRTRVPAGAVAIGGAQTGIYPRELPGGWQIIGRTPCRLFDPAGEPPALLAPGQPLRFRAIDTAEFHRIQHDDQAAN